MPRHTSSALPVALRKVCCTLRMKRVHAIPVAIVWSLTVALAGCERRQSASAGGNDLRRHNVLLITLDTTRADRLGCYGYAPAATPNLDALARRGTLFEDAHAQVPLTLPSHASLLTGRYPRELGIHVNGRNRLGADPVILSAAFKRHAYRTAAFVSTFVLSAQFGLDRGFDLYDDDVGEPRPGTDGWELERPAGATTDRALAWLESIAAEPFFCWVHYYDPHEPYDPPTEYRAAGADSYDGEIAFVDSQLGRLFDWLESTGLDEKTLVVVVGDHGESFGEHGENGHTVFLYSSNVRVPLIFAHPTAVSSRKRVAATVSVLDVFPTILDLFGWERPTSLQGESLVEALRGQRIQPRRSFSESLYVHELFGWAQQHALTTFRWKYISSTKPELYDRRDDPDERRNLIDARPDIASAMRNELEAMHASMAPFNAEGVPLDVEAIRKLESLGYASGGNASGFADFLTAGLSDPKEMLDVIGDLATVRSLERKNKVADAIAVLLRAAKRCPQSVYVHEKLGRCYLKVGETSRALESLRVAVNLDPTNYPALRSMADALARTGKLDDAIAHYQIALTLRGEDAQTHFNLGCTLVRNEQWDEGIDHLRQATKLKSDYGQALYRLGTALRHQRELAEARGVFEQAAKLKGVGVGAHFNLATLALEERNTEKARRHLERVLELDPIHKQAMAMLLRIYLASHRIGDMIAMLRRAVALAPNNPALANDLAELLVTARERGLRNGPEGLDLAKRAVRATNRREPAALATLAAAYAETGAFDRAVETAEEAVRLAEELGSKGLADHLRLQLEGYRESRPFRNPAF